MQMCVACRDAVRSDGGSLSCRRLRYTSHFCVSLWVGEEALTLSGIEKCTCASACVSDDRSVLDGGARPMMQTRCAGDEDYCTNRSENEHSGMSACRCVQR